MRYLTQMSKITTKKIVCLLGSLLVLSCTEVPIITSQGESRLDSPSSMAILSGTDCAIVANANVNLDQPMGSLVVVDLNANELLLDTEYKIPNFAGGIFVDEGRSRIYIPDRDESLLIYEYEINGTNCNSITFSKKDVPVPVDTNRSNGIETDDGPTQAYMVPGTSDGDLIFVTNQKGSVSVIKASYLKSKDLDT